MAAVSALFLLDIKGRVLVWRDYRGDVTALQAEKFFTKLIEKEGDPQSQDPVVYDNGVSYMFIEHSNVYLMTASRQNYNAASLLSFLHRVVFFFFFLMNGSIYFIRNINPICTKDAKHDICRNHPKLFCTVQLM
ncbi:AP-1 complex subunit mu-2 [Linum perenne]